MIDSNKNVLKGRRLSAEARREEIVSAALELAARRGPETTTTEDMAEAVGLTQGAIFRHFPTKDAIWLAVIEWVRGQVMRIVDDAAARGSDPFDSLEKIFHAHIAFIARHPGIPRLLFSELRNSRDTRLKHLIQELVAGYEARIIAILEEAASSGLAAAPLDAQSAATLFLAMLQGLVMQGSTFGGKRQLAGQARKIFPIYLAGIRCGSQTAAPSGIRNGSKP